jgi:hypothetical protein
LNDSFLDQLEVIDDTDTFQSEQAWVDLKQVDGQLIF